MFCFCQPYAWDSREFLRKKIVGKEVTFTFEYKLPGTGKELGHIFIGKGRKYTAVVKNKPQTSVYLSIYFKAVNLLVLLI